MSQQLFWEGAGVKPTVAWSQIVGPIAHGGRGGATHTQTGGIGIIGVACIVVVAGIKPGLGRRASL